MIGRVRVSPLEDAEGYVDRLPFDAQAFELQADLADLSLGSLSVQFFKQRNVLGWKFEKIGMPFAMTLDAAKLRCLLTFKEIPQNPGRFGGPLFSAGNRYRALISSKRGEEADYYFDWDDLPVEIKNFTVKAGGIETAGRPSLPVPSDSGSVSIRIDIISPVAGLIVKLGWLRHESNLETTAGRHRLNLTVPNPGLLNRSTIGQRRQDVSIEVVDPATGIRRRFGENFYAAPRDLTGKISLGAIWIDETLEIEPGTDRLGFDEGTIPLVFSLRVDSDTDVDRSEFEKAEVTITLRETNSIASEDTRTWTIAREIELSETDTYIVSNSETPVFRPGRDIEVAASVKLGSYVAYRSEPVSFQPRARLERPFYLASPPRITMGNRVSATSPAVLELTLAADYSPADLSVLLIAELYELRRVQRQFGWRDMIAPTTNNVFFQSVAIDAGEAAVKVAMPLHHLQSSDPEVTHFLLRLSGQFTLDSQEHFWKSSSAIPIEGTAALAESLVAVPMLVNDIDSGEALGLMSLGRRRRAPQPSAKRLSGAHWHSKFPNSAKLSDLSTPFRKNCTAFVNMLRDNGARVAISSTRRPAKRAYLMHWAFKIANGDIDPKNVPARRGVDIVWDHGNKTKSIRAAKAMVRKYNIAYGPALNSRHIAGKAIDMTITKLPGTLNFRHGEKTLKVTIGRRKAASNEKLWKLAKKYFSVHKLRNDPPHWYAL